MPRPDLPTDLEYPYTTKLRDGIWSISDRVDTLEAGGGGGGTGEITATMLGRAFHDARTESTDDAKLDAGLTAINVTHPPTYTFGNRQTPYSWAVANRPLREALRLQGAFGYSLPERNGQTKMASRHNLTMTGGWWQMVGSSTIFQVGLANFPFVGGSNARVIDQGVSTAALNIQMRDIYSSGLRNVLGSQTTKALLLASQLDGSWEINNCYNGAFHIGGSDNTLWPAGMLLDSGTGFNTAGSANGQYHLWCDYLEKSDIGPLYETAEGAWNGIRHTGPSNPATSGGSNLGGPNIFRGLRLEGRNAGQPCNGSLFRMEGGLAVIRDSWLGYAMASPTTPGHSPQDAGVVHQSGGILTMDGNTYDRATGVLASVPFVYVNGGELMITKTMRGSKGGSWSTRPVVDDVSGTGVLVSDASVSVV